MLLLKIWTLLEISFLCQYPLNGFNVAVTISGLVGAGTFSTLWVIIMTWKVLLFKNV